MLVAISIPIFTSQLEKSREATDASNIRAAYAEIAAAALTDPDTAQTATVEKKQKQDDWQSASAIDNIAGVAITSINSTDDTTVTYSLDDGVQIDGNAVTSSFVNSSSSGGTTP